MLVSIVVVVFSSDTTVTTTNATHIDVSHDNSLEIPSHDHGLICMVHLAGGLGDHLQAGGISAPAQIDLSSGG